MLMYNLGIKGHNSDRGMRRYASTERIRPKNNMREDEEGLIYDEDQGFDISPKHRRK